MTTPVEVPLTRGKVALVSPEDAERVLAHKWCYHGNGYACRTTRRTLPNGRRQRKEILLHRFLIDAPEGMDVDHKDGDGLNCQRDNLRIATRSQNAANSGCRKGKYKGVSYRADRGTWRAEITINCVKRHLGTFRNEEDAAKRYDYEAYVAWGAFAHLNFPHLKHLYQQSIVTTRLHRSMPTIARR